MYQTTDTIAKLSMAFSKTVNRHSLAREFNVHRNTLARNCLATAACFEDRQVQYMQRLAALCKQHKLGSQQLSVLLWLWHGGSGSPPDPPNVFGTRAFSRKLAPLSRPAHGLITLALLADFGGSGRPNCTLGNEIPDPNLHSCYPPIALICFQSLGCHGCHAMHFVLHYLLGNPPSAQRLPKQHERRI
jgi:hypothetical protein